MFTRVIGFALIFGLLISLGIFARVVAQDQDKQEKEIAWFDMEHCAICKNLASQKENMHKIKWEMHNLENGTLSISIVPGDMKEAMAETEKGIEKTVAKLMTGKQLDLCGYCQEYGRLMASGAKFDMLKTIGGDISIVTSTDPEIVKQIHAFGKKSKLEHDKMVKQTKTYASKKKQ